MAEECSSCHAPVIWATSTEEPKPGERPKRNPIDHATGHQGNLEVWRDGQGIIRYRYLRKGEEPAAGHFRGTSHFAVCPNAAQHRKRDTGPPRTTKAEREAAVSAPPPPGSAEEAYAHQLRPIAEHIDCDWVQVGKCVYCRSHPGVRFGQGRVPTREQRAEIRAECVKAGLLEPSPAPGEAWPAGSNGEAARRNAG